MCFSPEDEAKERDLGVAQRLLDFTHRRGAFAEGDRLLPSILSAVQSPPLSPPFSRWLLRPPRIASHSSSFLPLPLINPQLPSLATTNVPPSKTELYATGASSGQRPVGRLCGGIENGLGFALLRLDHTTATLTPSPSAGAAPSFLARPLWPPPYLPLLPHEQQQQQQ
jgi:hypothetical protein